MGYCRGGGLLSKGNDNLGPLPRDFTKNCFKKKCFNKDIEMSSIMFLSMLYRHEKVLEINLA
jgi:hypothetical protein